MSDVILEFCKTFATSCIIFIGFLMDVINLLYNI